MIKIDILFQYNLGKYWFKEMKNTTAIYVVNEKYYNHDFKPIINEIYVTTYNSMGEIYNAFKAGNVDIITTNLNNAAEYIGTEGYERVDIKGRDFHFLSMNNKKIGLEDRKKITEGLGINQIITGLGVLYSGYPLDYGISQYNGTVLNNQEEADKEKDFKNINRTIIVNEANSLQVQMAERIVEQLNKKGAKVKLTKLKSDKYYKQIENKEYDMAIIGIRQSYIPDISKILDVTGVEDTGVTEILNKLQKLWIDEKSSIEKKEILKQLEQKEKELENKKKKEDISEKNNISLDDNEEKKLREIERKEIQEFFENIKKEKIYKNITGIEGKDIIKRKLLKYNMMLYLKKAVEKDKESKE